MTLRYILVNIHINNQPTLYKVNGIVLKGHMKGGDPKPRFSAISDKRKSELEMKEFSRRCHNLTRTQFSDQT
jgi:hypothetical protein